MPSANAHHVQVNAWAPRNVNDALTVRAAAAGKSKSQYVAELLAAAVGMSVA